MLLYQMDSSKKQQQKTMLIDAYQKRYTLRPQMVYTAMMTSWTRGVVYLIAKPSKRIIVRYPALPNERTVEIVDCKCFVLHCT